LIEDGHRWTDVQTYTLPQIRWFYSSITPGINPHYQADLLETFLLALHPGKRGERATQAINKLRAYGK